MVPQLFNSFFLVFPVFGFVELGVSRHPIEKVRYEKLQIEGFCIACIIMRLVAGVDGTRGNNSFHL